MNEIATAAPMNSIGSASDLMMDSGRMDSMMRLADIMASGKSTLPAHFRNSPGDCMAVVMQSAMWGLNPFAVAQKTSLISGTLFYEGQLVSAVISASGVITKDDFDYEFFGPWEKVVGKFIIKKGEKGEYRAPGWTMADEIGCGVFVRATMSATGKVKEKEVLLAEAGVRNSTLWASDPKQQLSYLAVRRWARLHTPGVILGVYTPDEFEQTAQVEQKTQHMGAAEVVIPVDLLNAANAAAKAGVAAYSKFWSDSTKGGGTTKEQRQLLGAGHEARKATAIAADASRTIDQDDGVVDAEFVAGLDKAPA